MFVTTSRDITAQLTTDMTALTCKIYGIANQLLAHLLPSGDSIVIASKEPDVPTE